MKDFSEELKQVPEQPGVYLMHGEDDTVIYVGKAVNLRRRVRSYFTKSTHGKSPKVLAMVEHVVRFEYIVVENEVEALVLESNFIKSHRPKYNILLRDDKQYPYICIPKESFPRLLKVRHAKNDGGTYFGPFPNAYAVNDTIRLLQRLYSIRTCRLDFEAGQRLSRPCLNHYIGQCPAPCVGKADAAKYDANLDQVKDLLNGKDRKVREEITRRMQEAAANLEFERAASYRDDLQNLDALMEKQQVTSTAGQDADVIAMARGAKQVTMQVFFVRGGKMVDRESFTMEEMYTEEANEIISSFLKQFYLNASYLPNEILVEEMPTDAEAIVQYLSDKKGKRVVLHVPKRGDKAAFLQTAQSNAQEQLRKAEMRLERKERNQDRGIGALEKIVGRSLNRVESYDISNISGVANVGSMVVFAREKKVPKEYRKFRIRTVEGANEYASQREMLTRRVEHGLRDRAEGKTQTGFGQFPSIILMDGGKGQVNLAESILRHYGLDIPVVGMVKDSHHLTRSLLYQNREIALDVRSPLYKYLFAVQEEVHRFAIDYHHKLRSKEMTRSELDEIPGIGKVRRTALLRAFGSVEAVKKATIEDIAAVPGMTKKETEMVRTYFDQPERRG